MPGRVPTLQLPRSLEGSLAAGHPWVYRDHVDVPASLASGAWVRVVAGSFSAYGIWDPESAIAVRLYSRKGVPDGEWLDGRVAEAWALRASLRQVGTTAYRCVHGEGDGLPGVVVDVYGPYAVIRLDNPSVATRLRSWVVAAVRAAMQPKGIVERNAEGDLECLHGRLPSPDLVVEESGLRMQANLFEGQKTGLFLDQRENRQTLQRYCSGATVLNLFSYTGGFSLHAVRGGARQVVSVDASEGALVAARANFALNGFDAEAHGFEVADVFEYLARSDSKTYDVVVCDPPTFARRRSKAEAARRAYAKLNSAAIAKVRSGGWLVSSSCTTQVSVEAFRSALAVAASRARRTLQIVHDAGQPLDHPVAAGHPEGRYLKFVVCRVSATS